MASSHESQLSFAEHALSVFFSWFVFAAVSIIISGKLLGSRFVMGFVQEDRFRVPLGIFDIRARGDQVSLGLLAFLASFAVWVCFGGEAAYHFFKRQAGLDLGQWNSLCVLASFSALLVSFVIYVIAPFFGVQPVINSKTRSDLVNRLGRTDED